MPDETPIYITNDLDAERSYVRSGGRDWIFVYQKGTVEWWCRFDTWSKTETTIIENEGALVSLTQLYDLAEAVLCPENGTREQLERRGPVTIAGACRLFANAWFNGPAILDQIAARVAALSQAEQPEPDIQPQTEAAPKRGRRSA